jgi:hypothetical protein
MTVMDYRTRDGLAAYGFSIEPHPGAGWRVYIIFIPSYQSNKIPDLPYEPVDDKRATMQIGRRNSVAWRKQEPSPVFGPSWPSSIGALRNERPLHRADRALRADL